MDNTKLWNKNFTIITIGTIVSMLGNAVSAFAIGLLVLDYTSSTLLYVLFQIAYNAPKIIMPMIMGPFLDRFSRSKMIYTLDYLSCLVYLGIFLIIHFEVFNFVFFLFLAVFIGSIDSVYTVAYDSLYPLLVSPNHYRKAYSISSMLYPISAVMIPVAAVLYQSIGLKPLFIFNAVTFFIAATMEIFIKADESQISDKKSMTLKEFSIDFKQGINYIWNEKGLLFITIFFFFYTLFSSGNALVFPYFKSQESLGIIWYIVVVGASVVGRLVGGIVHYKLKYPPKMKYFIAIVVFMLIAICDGTFLLTPIWCMTLFNFLSGLFNSSAYNLRISATQSYVPNELRGRFNGTFQMICALSGIIGQLAAGVLSEFMTEPTIIFVFMIFALISVGAILIPGRKHASKIYNLINQ